MIKKNTLTFFIFYLLCSSSFFSGFTFYKEALCLIIFRLSLCSNMLNLENILEYIRQKLKKHAHFKISSRDEVFTCLFFLFSSWDEISSRQKRVNSKRHFTIDRDDFISGWNFTCKHPLRNRNVSIFFYPNDNHPFGRFLRLFDGWANLLSP